MQRRKARTPFGIGFGAGYSGTNVMLKCDHCGAVFSRARHLEAHHANKHYCSTACFKASRAVHEEAS